MKHLVEVEERRVGQGNEPSLGPAYRNVLAKDGFPSAPVGVETCWDIFRMSVEKYPDNRMLGHRDIIRGQPGKYVWCTYKQVYKTVLKVGVSIRRTGVEKGGRCGIYAANCPEWIVTMEACNAHGIYCVPLYDSLGPGAVQFIICHAEVEIVFVEEKKIEEVIKTFPHTTQYLKTIVSFGKFEPEHKDLAEISGLKLYEWDEFLLLGGNQQFELPEKKSTDICTIMYTSGTTGDPKGVLMSNGSIVKFLAGAQVYLHGSKTEFSDKDVYISYLPLAHMFDRVVEELVIFHGASIGFWSGNIKTLVDDLVALKPTIFCAVPRVLDRIYSGLNERISAVGFLKHSMYNYAYNSKQRNMSKGLKHDEAGGVFDKLVLSKVKQGLGGKVRFILSGAAPLANHVENYLRVVSGSAVVQGYGLTETCAGTFVSIPNVYSMLGTVGPPLPNVDVRLMSVPEMNYDALSVPPRGEVCIRGDTLFSGYHKRDDLTKEVMIDGWFHTGDIGEWQPEGTLKIIDRKKNIFKLSQGVYVSVENLESIYSHVAALDSIWVYGNSYEHALVAVVNPNQSTIENWAEDNGVSGDFNRLCQDPKVKEYMILELAKISKSKKLKGFEFIKAVHLDPTPFDMERDLLTPTYKKKRPQLLKHYQKVVDQMYASLLK